MVGSIEGTGSATVYRFNGTSWYEEQTLTPADGGGNGFGRPVSLSGDTALIGANGDDCAAGTVCEAAYVFCYTGTSWVQQQELISSDAESGDSYPAEFGHAVAADGEVIAVGAWHEPCEDVSGLCGSAYVLRGEPPLIPATSTWGQMCLALLVLAAGTIAIRRTSNAVAAG